MYFKLFAASLVFALGTISAAAQSFEGRFLILNVRTHTTARSYPSESSVFVTNTVENPGPFEIWDFIPDNQGGYAIKNVGKEMYAGADESGDSVVVTQNDPMSFSVTPATAGGVNIGAVSEDLLWTVAYDFGRRNVTFDPATGDSGQRWQLIPSNDSE